MLLKLGKNNFQLSGAEDGKRQFYLMGAGYYLTKTFVTSIKLTEKGTPEARWFCMCQLWNMPAPGSEPNFGTDPAHNVR
jgi:hypothetical protein